MFDLEKAIKRWIKSLHKYEVFEDGLIADLELHLRDVVDSQREKGVNEEEAFRLAVAQVGTAKSIAAEYTKNRLAGLDRRSPLRLSRLLPPLVWNYIKIILRRIRRQKGYSFINIAGLTIGMASFIVIFSFIQFELSFDNFHQNSDRIYRLVEKQTFQGQDPQHLGTSTPWMGETLVDYPEVSKVVNFIGIGRTQVRRDGEIFEIQRSLLADPDVFTVFSFELIQGVPETALIEPFTAVITEDTAQRLFRDQNPMGKVLRAGDGNDYKVTGVVKNIPRNSHIQFDILYSIEAERLKEPDWNNHNHNSPTYLLLERGIRPESLEIKFPQHLKKYWSRSADHVALYLQPLSEIHLHSQHIMWEINSNKSSIQYIYFFSLIVFFILLIACINYINLTTARSFSRAREVGIRKVVGARRIQLVKQLIGESLIFTLFSFLAALGLIELVKPLLNDLLSETTAFQYSLTGPVFLGFLGFMLCIGAASGIYPALVLSAFRPAAVLKNSFSSGGRGFVLRRLLVVVQFAISIALIISTVFVYKQLNYMLNRDTGFERDHIVTLPMNSEMQQRFDLIREELVQNPEIKDVTASMKRLGTSLPRSIIYFEGADPNEQWIIPYMTVDFGFIPFYDLEILQGRNFSKDFGDDKRGKSYIINETLMKKLGWEDPIGKKFSNGCSERGKVIGVVKDYNYRSLHRRIEPVVLFMRQDFLLNMSVKIEPGKTSAALKHLEKMWETYSPGQGFQYTFLDKTLAALYRSEERSQKLFGLFAVQAIIISCLGLFALASYTVERKTREIGIRKVLGSTVPEIFVLLSKNFIKWVSLANLFAWPVAWYAMKRWLQNFAYRVDMNIGVFMLGAGLALFITLLTLSYQVLKAAGANPVDCLRYE